MAWCHVKNQILVSRPEDCHKFHDLLVSVKLLKETVLLLAPFPSTFTLPHSRHCQSNQTNPTKQKVSF